MRPRPRPDMKFEARTNIADYYIYAPLRRILSAHDRPAMSQMSSAKGIKIFFISEVSKRIERNSAVSDLREDGNTDAASFPPHRWDGSGPGRHASLKTGRKRD
jgi:hypothetical protein